MGWRERFEICAVRVGEVGLDGGVRGGARVRMCVYRAEKVGYVALGSGAAIGRT